MIGNEEISHGNAVGGGVGYGGGGGGGGCCSMMIIGIFSLLSSAGLVGVGREWHEEINLTALEVSFGWDDDDLGEGRGGVVSGGGGRGGGLFKDVFRMGFHDIGSFDGAGDFFDVAIGVDYANYIKSSARKNAGYAASYAIFHCLNTKKGKRKQKILNLNFEFVLCIGGERD